MRLFSRARVTRPRLMRLLIALLIDARRTTHYHPRGVSFQFLMHPLFDALTGIWLYHF